ncbi:hypothetical protein [Dinghuibacter silviterrae]|uniref:Uncharacterized protein n=1 Tax=Dinghuibacter silviterrae TaxID=1539049 RepID=A0A4R8DSD6_9BACT|nr:hypothetical protein [Dinghuibacter silviterrae]TDX00758.1 hypothetical protein EDB95_1786 [Dinghuibacter silviterrae]
MKTLSYIGSLLLLLAMGCRKVTYNSIGKPAYFRFFNSMNYLITPATKDEPQPYLAMVVDPQFDANGVVTGGAVVGDFLDKRATYAPPYPANAGNTSVDNYEYPGSEKVLVGPILNGFDLSSWAQIASGKHRFVFYSRPVSQTPFFQLAANQRKFVFADTTVDLAEGEVYTMELLQHDVYSNPVQIDFYMRQEQFTKLSFDDSLCYVNFYNLGADGFTAQAIAQQGTQGGGNYIQDTMNIYMTLHYPDSASWPGNAVVPGYQYIPVNAVIRSHNSGVAPYISFPVFPAYAGVDTTFTRSGIWEEFMFLSPDYYPALGSFPSYNASLGDYAVLACTSRYYQKGNYGPPNNDAYLSPNLIITIPSGTSGNRSFSTISTVEVINNQAYVMSVQRQYAPPVETY